MKVRKLFTQAFLILTVFGLALNAAQAQNSIRLVTVKGHITDSNGEPLAGVSVMVPSSTTGVTSDSEGDYLIRVGEGCQLNYSFIGFESQNYKITQDRTINIVMTESAQSIDQVVV
ncbi:MAG: carboxypeptidase-like regulatory domain-containing protein, partial [Bacteroidales bacterium]